MAKKIYVVWQGRVPGIFLDWDSCKKQVDKFIGAQYKSFSTLDEAKQAFVGTHSVSKHRSATINPLSRSVAHTTRSKADGIKTHTSTEIAKMPIDVKIYTDGGCDPNPGKAGTGMAIYRNERISELWYGLYNPMGTNNTAELNGLHQALYLAQIERNMGKSVAIFCDSKYSIQCVTQWAIGWQKKGWRKSGGEIKNLELIKEMFALYQQLRDEIKVLHVNAHVGIEGNELADRMSILAISEKNSNFNCYQPPININTILAMKAG